MSATFLLNGAVPSGAVLVTAGSTVTLALTNTSGANNTTWAFVGTSESITVPTITVTGLGTATFVAPVAPSHGLGVSMVLECVNGSELARALVCVGATTMVSANEVEERGSPQGWAWQNNANIRGAMTSSAPLALYLKSLTTSVDVQSAAAPSAGQALIATGSAAATWTYPIAWGLKSATTTVSISGATAPTAGQVLTSTSGTAATWQPVPIPGMYGSGVDGPVSVTSGTTTLARDMHYTTLTITAGQINTNGYRIYCSTALDLSGASATARIYCTGNAAFSGDGYTPARGTVRGHRGSVPGPTAGNNSGECSSGWGGKGGDGSSPVYRGWGGTVAAYPVGDLYTQRGALDLGGGGGGSGPEAASGGGEGASGIFISAATLIRANTNAAGTIISTGGAGGSATSANYGSGGGGGGAVMLHVGSVSGTIATSFLRSVGGVGGSAPTTAGQGGYGGVCSILILNTSETYAGPAANSGATGGITNLSV
jgi:hypothetical protein